MLCVRGVYVRTLCTHARGASYVCVLCLYYVMRVYMSLCPQVCMLVCMLCTLCRLRVCVSTYDTLCCVCFVYVCYVGFCRSVCVVCV